MQYPAKYKDADGVVDAVVESDGSSLVVQVNAVRFTGYTWDDLKTEDELPGRFTLNDFGAVIDCEIEYVMPFVVLVSGTEAAAELGVHIDLRVRPGSWDYSWARMILRFNERTYPTDRFNLFEGGFEWLKAAMLPGMVPKCCYTCAFSDYNVAGQDFFGGLKCFRNMKAEYLAARGKGAYMDIMFLFDQTVQETHCCDEFALREAGTGYRG